jgi:hypothetical protein
MGYNGKKVGFFLLKSTDAMRDDGSPHGELYNKMKQIEKAHKTLQGKKIKCLSLPMDNVITYDLENYQLQFNEDFNMETFLRDSKLGQIERVVDKKLQDFTRELGASVKYSL